MARKKSTLTKATYNRLNKFFKDIKDRFDDPDALYTDIEKTLLFNSRHIHEVNEKTMYYMYVQKLQQYIDTYHEDTIIYTPDILKNITSAIRSELVSTYCDDTVYTDNIDIYFNDVKREYIRHPITESESYEFLPENRDVYIKNNLKLVVNCAKRYRGLGMPFEDLIQIGNLGLLKAFDKFDSERSNLRGRIIETIQSSENETFTYTDAYNIIENAYEYNKELNTTLDRIPEGGFTSKEEFTDWVRTNVKTAVFASVAFHWIRAFILSEVTKLNKPWKIMKVDPVYDSGTLGNDTVRQFESMTCTSSKTPLVSLDYENPYSDDAQNTENIISEYSTHDFEDHENDIDTETNTELMNSVLYNALGALSPLEKRLVKKRYGIGMPSELSINEIAESEGLTPNKVKYALTVALRTMSDSVSDSTRELLTGIFE